MPVLAAHPASVATSATIPPIAHFTNPQTPQASKRKPQGARKMETLFITDAELTRRIGVPEKIARAAIHALDRDDKGSGFPQKQALWGNRRYWPAVRAWFDRQYISGRLSPR